ncbi:hypothetical protein VTO42DRAFT_3606 [Malbranchea cinnamomea]
MDGRRTTAFLAPIVHEFGHAFKSIVERGKRPPDRGEEEEADGGDDGDPHGSEEMANVQHPNIEGFARGVVQECLTILITLYTMEYGVVYGERIIIRGTVMFSRRLTNP